MSVLEKEHNEKLTGDDINSSAGFYSIFEGVSSRLVKVSAIVGAAVIIMSLTAGYFLPKSDGLATAYFERLQKHDKLYLSAKEENDSAAEELRELRENLREKQKETESLQTSQSNLGKIKSENEALTAQYEALQTEIAEKEKKLASVTEALDSARVNITLGEGTFTVGEQISPGKYSVTGSGNIVISHGGTSRVNETLKADGKSYTLNDGDLLRIKGQAHFALEN